MGFGGSVQSMITILKNNEKMRSKRNRKTFKGSCSSVKLQFPNTATKQDLKKIKKNIQSEQKQLQVKQMLVFGFVFSILITLVIMYI
ncbi:hypothetical protein KO494_06885 [Lacinutrix sp. C3R15]|uniref:hypothetical protein n=1 Tax=Flavobacteriaceae TaxID=49546 RepID=UPI001C0A5310|nr:MULTISPECIES: hypothetical protein [Flavobacteriaceae]MBU2939260.1 hypothetical protein [Lacinutrix sp. C3R15]MDO6622575.1 hypothetical protein [Oceanihabitans sp. 1_MG-2023]